MSDSPCQPRLGAPVDGIDLNGLDFVGEGRSRLVLAVDDHYVVKVAKNEGGRLQNLREAIISSAVPAGFQLIAKVFDVCDAGRLIVAERHQAIILTEADGTDAEMFAGELYRSLATIRSGRGTMPGVPYFEELAFLVRTMDCSTWDLERIDNWGRRVAFNGVKAPVLLDYGTVEEPDFFAKWKDALGALLSINDES